MQFKKPFLNIHGGIEEKHSDLRVSNFRVDIRQRNLWNAKHF